VAPSLLFFDYALSFARSLFADDERLYRWTRLSLGVAVLQCVALYILSELSFRFIERPSWSTRADTRSIG
jgi:hypothetical protein